MSRPRGVVPVYDLGRLSYATSHPVRALADDGGGRLVTVLCALAAVLLAACCLSSPRHPR